MLQSKMGPPVRFVGRQQHNISLDEPARQAIRTIQSLAPQAGITEPMITMSDVIRFSVRFVSESLQDMDHDVVSESK